MIAYVLLVLLVASTAAGAGYAGVRVGARHVRGELTHVFQNIYAAGKRANHASAAIEAADLQAVLERLENVANQARKAALIAQTAKESAVDAVARQDELEQAVAAGLAIELRRS